MSESKIQFKVGIVEFSGEGNQDWLASQLKLVLDKVPELLKLELANPSLISSNNGGAAPPKLNLTGKPKNLSLFLKEKGATTNQVKKFLATAAFLQLGGKKRLSTGDITKAIKDANQTKLVNASDCLNQNVKKGHSEKDGGEFFVTSHGFSELSIEE